MVHHLSIVSAINCCSAVRDGNPQISVIRRNCDTNTAHLMYICSILTVAPIKATTFPILTTALKVMNLETCHIREDECHVEIV